MVRACLTRFFLRLTELDPELHLALEDHLSDRVKELRSVIAAAEKAVQSEMNPGVSSTYGVSLGAPNGITWDAAGQRFIVVPYGGGHDIFAWQPGGTGIEKIGNSQGAKFDGVEVLSGGRILVASQGDSSLHLFSGGSGRPIIRTTGAPADIAVDTRRNRVAVPYISLDRVDIWQLPAN